MLICLESLLIVCRLMRPTLSPENIYAHRHEEQDVILWYNRALWHSIVSDLSIWKLMMTATNSLSVLQTEFPKSYGPRVMHQCNVAASDHPIA
jgi:xanthine dioxygenase